mgnify:CR=1 FL=1
MYRFDDFLADPETWRLSRDGQEIHIEPVVLDLLIYLIQNRERLVTRHELMETVWGDTVISEAALTKAVARLRKALGDDSVTHRYLETVRSRGYRFVADVEEIESADQSALAPGKARAAAARRATQAGAAVIIVLTILAVSWFRMPAHETPQEQVIRSLAVLPLSNLTGDPEQGYYVDGLQDLLITELSQLPGLRVTSRQSTKRYRDSQLTTADIAGELGVDSQNYMFGAGWSGNAFDVSAVYVNQEVDTSDFDSYALSAAYTWGNNKFIGTFGQSDWGDDDGMAYGVAVQHMFSKRTSAYLGYSESEMLNAHRTSKYLGVDSEAGSFGMIHKF